MRLLGIGPDEVEGAVVGGLPGRAATVAAGSTTTGLPGTSASVSNSGSSNAAVLNFTIPRGDVGPQGAPGTPGSVTITGLGSAETIGRLVWTSASGGTTAANGANTWAKIASFSFGTTQWVGGSVLLNVSSHSQQATFENEINIVSVSVYQSDSGNVNPPGGYVEILGKSGSFNIPNDGFKLISNGYSSAFELWVRKGSTAGQLSAFEVSRSSGSGLMSVTYHGGSAWQAAAPSGIRLNVSSKGVTAGGLPVANLPNLPLTGGNLVPNPSFELDGFKYANAYAGDGITTEQARSGTRSFKTTGHKYPTFSADSSGAEVKIPCVGSDTIYLEAWIRGHTSNVATTAGAYFQIMAYRADGSYSSVALLNGPNLGTALNGVWTKMAGYVTLPSDAASFTFQIVISSNVVATNVYYFDDLKCYRATLPDYAVTTTGAQVLTNKTLTSPTVNTPTINTPTINSATFSAATVFNGGAGNPQLYCESSNANASMNIYSKGTGVIALNSSTGQNIVAFAPVASGVDSWFIANAAAGGTLVCAASGVSSNINMTFNPKGTGRVQIGGSNVPYVIGVPATTTTAGKTGEIALDNSWLYVCTAANTWRRVALATW